MRIFKWITYTCTFPGVCEWIAMMYAGWLFWLTRVVEVNSSLGKKSCQGERLLCLFKCDKWSESCCLCFVVSLAFASAIIFSTRLFRTWSIWESPRITSGNVSLLLVICKKDAEFAVMFWFVFYIEKSKEIDVSGAFFGPFLFSVIVFGFSLLKTGFCGCQMSGQCLKYFHRSSCIDWKLLRTEECVTYAFSSMVTRWNLYIPGT